MVELVLIQVEVVLLLVELVVVEVHNLSVNETYWVHVVSYSYYACCTLCGADLIPSRSTSRGAV